MFGKDMVSTTDYKNAATFNIIVAIINAVWFLITSNALAFFLSAIFVVISILLTVAADLSEKLGIIFKRTANGDIRK